MISKQDCLLLLSELNATDKIKELLTQNVPSLNILKYINDTRELDLTAFYRKIRKSYNNKKSKLYINVVKEIDEPEEVLTTLSAMLTQILLYSKTVENKTLFLRSSRANEISAVLNNYFNTYDMTNCIKLLRLIKADIKICEYMDREN